MTKSAADIAKKLAESVKRGFPLGLTFEVEIAKALEESFQRGIATKADLLNSTYEEGREKGYREGVEAAAKVAHKEYICVKCGRIARAKGIEKDIRSLLPKGKPVEGSKK